MRFGESQGLTLFDSNAANPYSAELLAMFGELGFDARLVGPVDLEQSSGRLRPYKRAANSRDAVREIAETLRVAFGGTTVLIVWARTYQKLLFAVSGVLHIGNFLYVVHNPVASRWPTGWRALVESLIIRYSRCLTHSSQLRLDLHALKAADSVVVPHPLYRVWVERWVPTGERTQADRESVHLLLLGRADKFAELDRLLDSLRILDRPAILRVLIRPALAELPSIKGPVTIDDRSRHDWIPDEEVGEALAWADVLVSPYSQVTESGTVQLALSAGVKVVAFRGGALGDSLTDQALVEVDDFEQLLTRALQVALGNTRTARFTLEERWENQQDAWRRALIT